MYFQLQKTKNVAYFGSKMKSEKIDQLGTSGLISVNEL